MKRTVIFCTAVVFSSFLLIAGNVFAQCVPPPTGMVAWWPFDEILGSTAADIAGFPNDGTHFFSPTPTPGKVDTALCFNGIDQYVEVADQLEINFDTLDFSIDGWIRTTDSIGVDVILDKRDATERGCDLYLFNGNLGVRLADGTGLNYNSTAFLATGSWEHFAVTVDRNNMAGIIFYRNGAQVGAGQNPTAHQGSLTNTSPLTIAVRGVAFGGGGYFNGCLDELEMFNRVLTPPEVLAIFNADSLGKCKPGTIQGQKFNDLDCDGLLDPGEPFLNGWPINLYQGATLIASTTTGPNGTYSFTVNPGTYYITETVQPGWIQTFPPTVLHPVTLLTGQFANNLHFGNTPDTCDQFAFTKLRLDGGDDNFVGLEPTTPDLSPGGDLDPLNTNLCPLAPNNFFDSPQNDMCIPHTFSFWDSTCCVLDARLCLKVKALGGDPGNDGIYFFENGVSVWGISLASLTIAGTWNTGQILDTCLGLGNLPPSGSGSSFGVTNVLAALQDGDFSLIITDDTEIDFLELEVTICCPPNHYKTWRIQPLPFDDTVDVRDQFIQGDGMAIRLNSIDFLSNPVMKIVQNDTFNIIRPNDHLTWYRAETFLPVKTFEVNFVNQFESTTVRIDTLKYLLVPTQKAPHPAPDTLLGHYTAYRIDLLPISIPWQFQLSDQFDSVLGPEFIQGFSSPSYFLAPARKNNEPVYDTTTHYVAYEIDPKRFLPQTRQTNDQFGPHTMLIDSSWLLLVPTKKIAFKECIALPGDANASGTYTLADVIAIVNYIFNKPGCTPMPLCWLSGLLCRGDWNGSGTVSLVDVIQAVNYIFNKPGGPWNALSSGVCCLP